MAVDAGEMFTMDSGEAFTLAQITDVNMDDVAEVRGFNAPAGHYHFRGKDAQFAKRKVDNKDTLVIVVECEIKECKELHDPTVQNKEATMAGLVGKVHRETFFIKTADDLGRLKAFFVDTGFKPGPMKLADYMRSWIGTEFFAPISVKADKNDKDRFFHNINFGKVTPFNAAGAIAA